MTEAASSKIVIVSGQEFTVSADIGDDQIRQQLASTFPEVAAATIRKGSKTINGVDVPTVEFVKQAGTKGVDELSPAALADRISHVQRACVSHLAVDDRRLLRLVAGSLTINDVLTDETLQRRLEITESASGHAHEVHALCDRIIALPAVADDIPYGW